MGSVFDVHVPADIPESVNIKDVDGKLLCTVALSTLLDLFDRFDKEFDRKWENFSPLFCAMIGGEEFSETQYHIIRTQVQLVLVGDGKKNLPLLRKIVQEMEELPQEEVKPDLSSDPVPHSVGSSVVAGV